MVDIRQNTLSRRAFAAGASSALVLGASGALAQATAAPKLKVALTAVIAGSADVFLAQHKGFFKETGVDVEIELQGATAITNAAAGHVDAVQVGFTAAFSPTKNGHPAKVIYNVSPGVSPSNVAVAADSPFKDLLDLSGKTVVVLGIGTTSYGAARAYSRYIVEKGGKPLQIISTNSVATLNAQVISGIAAASVGVREFYIAEIEAGKVRIVVDAGGPLAQSLFRSDVANYGYWGIGSVLEPKRDAVVRFIAGLRLAERWIAKATPEEIAAALKETTYFGQISAAHTLLMVKAQMPFFEKNEGFISKDVWDASLKLYELYGMSGIDVMAPMFDYASLVDMSYWNQSTELLKKLGH